MARRRRSVRHAFAVQLLPPLTDPRIVMIEQMSKSIRLGFEVEELPGTLPIYFARKGEERNCVKIVYRDPTATS